MKSDDKTPAGGVPSTKANATPDPGRAPELAVAAEDLALYDAYHHELGMIAAESDREPTPEELVELAALEADALEIMSKSPEQVRAERRRR